MVYGSEAGTGIKEQAPGMRRPALPNPTHQVAILLQGQQAAGLMRASNSCAANLPGTLHRPAASAPALASASVCASIPRDPAQQSTQAHIDCCLPNMVHVVPQPKGLRQRTQQVALLLHGQQAAGLARQICRYYI